MDDTLAPTNTRRHNNEAQTNQDPSRLSRVQTPRHDTRTRTMTMKTKPLHVTIEDSFLGPWRARIDDPTVTDGWIAVRVTSRKHTHYKPGEVVTVRGEQVWNRHTFRKYRTLYQGKPALYWKATA